MLWEWLSQDQVGIYCSTLFKCFIVDKKSHYDNSLKHDNFSEQSRLPLKNFIVSGSDELRVMMQADHRGYRMLV